MQKTLQLYACRHSNNEMSLRQDIMLSLQGALLGMIYSSIWAIAVGFDDKKKITVRYYLDRDPKEEDYENLSEVMAEC